MSQFTHILRQYFGEQSCYKAIMDFMQLWVWDTDTIHNTLYTINYILYTIYHTLYTIHYTLYTIHYTL